MKMMQQFAVITLVLLVNTGNASFGQSSTDNPTEAEAQKKREDAFVAMLSNTTLTGSFTMDDNIGDAPKPERYEIEGVTKVTGDLWTIMTRIKYGKTDARVPVTLPIVWAGDTPMVSMTDATIPGMGSQFSARVIFHNNRYAGTWQHGPKGGHMFGTFEKTKVKVEAANEAK